MKILIVGAGEVGSYLAKFLVTEHHDVTMLDTDAEKIQLLGDQVDLRTYIGSGTSVAVLEKAEAGQAELLLAMTDSDEINMLTVYFSKCLGAKRAVARVGNEDVLTGHPEFYRRYMGIDLVVNPAMRAAAEATSAIMTGGASGIAQFGFGKIHCRSFDVYEGSPYTEKPIHELHMPGALVAAVTRGDEVIVPGGDDVIQAGDRLVVICRREAIRYVQQGVGETKEHIKRVFIVGGGNIGEAIAHYFDNQRFNVKLFEDNRSRAWELADALKYVKVFDSDGMDLDVLEQEYLESADAFIAATGSDEKNLMSCALAKEHGVARTVAVVNDAQFTALGRKLGLTATLAPRLLAAGQILTFVRGGNVNRISLLAEGRAEVIEFMATENSRLIDKPLMELDLPHGVIVGAILRKSKAVIPKGKDVIHPGDSVILFVIEERVPFVESLLRSEEQSTTPPSLEAEPAE